MYISDEFVFYEGRDLQSNNLEIFWSKTHLTNKKFPVGVLYWNIFCSNIEKAWNATYIFSYW